jgi:hypothetical protein
MPHCSIPVRPMACVMARPTLPPVFSTINKRTASFYYLTVALKYQTKILYKWIMWQYGKHEK